MKLSRATILRSLLGASCAALLPTTEADAAPYQQGGDPTTRGLLGWWRGDGKGGSRTGRHSGTLTGNVTYVPAVVGNGFYFTGGDDSVAIPDSPEFDLADSLSIACWVKVDEYPSGNQTQAMLVFRGDNRGGNDPFHLTVLPTGRVRFAIESEDNRFADISAPIALGRFVHVVATLGLKSPEKEDGILAMRLYIDGEPAAFTTTTFGPIVRLDAAQYPGIGLGNHCSIPNSGFRFPFHGALNDIRIYNRPLSPAEARSLYERSLSSR